MKAASVYASKLAIEDRALRCLLVFCVKLDAYATCCACAS